MGLLKKIKGELVDIIEWFDESRDTFGWRFPRYQNEIKNGAQLIVREGQEALFVYRGQLADRFGPGNYELTSENLPILSTLQGWKHGFNSPFRSEVYFISTRPVTDFRWGTPTPVTVRDPDFKMVQVRANGTAIVRVENAEIFLREVIGTNSSVTVEDVSVLLRRSITTAFSDMILETGLGVIDLQGRQVELAEQLRQWVQTRVDDEFGLKVQDLTMTISLPEEITAAMTRGVARGVEESGFLDNVGDLDRFAQARQADAMLAAAQNEGGGAMGQMMGMGMGMGMANQMANQMGQQQQQQQAPQQAPAAAPPPLPAAPSFHVEMNGQAQGPFDMEQLRAGAANGQLLADSLVWTAGMDAWQKASEVDALKPLFSAPPPLPPTPPAAGDTPPPPPTAGGADAPPQS